MNAMEISKVIAQVISGDKKAIELFVKMYGGVVRNAVAIVQPKGAGIDREDMCQEVWMHISRDGWKVLAELRSPDNIIGFMATTAYRKAMEIVRAEMKKINNIKMEKMAFYLNDLKDEMGDVPENALNTEEWIYSEKAGVVKKDDKMIMLLLNGCPGYSACQIWAVSKAISELKENHKKFLEKVVFMQMTIKEVMEEFSINTRETFDSKKSKLIKKIRNRVQQLVRNRELELSL